MMESAMRTYHLLASLILIPCLQAADGRQEISLSGPGWRLWRDADATWKDDVIVAPPVDLARLPVNPPTGGWATLEKASGAVPCAVPGTVEEYLGDGGGPESVKALQGVSWFWRTIDIPADAPSKVVRLEFEAVRQRAEVFLDDRLVGYDVVGMTPFTCTLPATPGKHRLAVRITNPGGRYDWMDEPQHAWGKHRIPMGRAFGGFAGGLKLVLREPVSCEDLWVRNTPDPQAVVVTVTIANPGTTPVTRDLSVDVEAKADGKPVVAPLRRTVTIPPGGTTVEVPVSAPQAARWDLEHPHLHTARVTLRDGTRVADTQARTFGFRWFAPEGVGQDATFRLNGHRVMVRTAISWGFWPITGLYPTQTMAERQVRVAKELGLNMLNFHRSPGHTNVLEEADRQGLLYYQEPGGYVSVGDDPVGQALARERVLRLVRRDRSHPSMVIYNFINEGWFRHGADKDPALLAIHRADLQAAHAEDPSRTYTYTSSWVQNKADMAEEPAKMHLRPYDRTVHMNGWFDHHRAGGPMVYRPVIYKGPEDFYARTTNQQEIIYHGEEGAMSSPPRLDTIVRELDAAARPGWDGAVYRQWQAAFAGFLDRKGLRSAYPTVDDLCQTLGRPSFEHQARKILLSRINDPTDGYAVNGWEAELIENHSGIVDCFRNPKGDPTILAAATRPVQLAVMPRRLTIGSPGQVVFDTFLIQEGRLDAGPATVRLRVTKPDGSLLLTQGHEVRVTGGEVFGQLLVRDTTIAIPAATAGFLRIEASLERNGTVVASGEDRILAVDWRSQTITGAGAVVEDGDAVQRHLQGRGAPTPAYATTMPRRDWIIAAASPSRTAVVPAQAWTGLSMVLTRGDQPGGEELLRRNGGTVALDVAEGATVDPSLPTLPAYTITYRGQLTPPRDGTYLLQVESRDAVTLTVNGQVLGGKDKKAKGGDGRITLTGGKPVPVIVELRHKERAYALAVRCILRWSLPEDPAEIADLSRRCREDGSTLVLLEGAGEWLTALKPTGVTLREDFELGDNWVGGQYASRPHPLFEGLPTGALDSYFGGVQDEKSPRRRGLAMEGEELVVAAYRTWPFKLGTAVGVIPWGKGRIIVSTLNIADRLDGNDHEAAVAKRLLGNYLRVALPAKP